MSFLHFLSEHGLDTVLIAIVTVALTGLLKTPVKLLASKSAKSKRITRFITFLPIAVGFGVTVLLTYLTENKIVFEQPFFARWLSAVSLSLAIYALWEKFVPSENKILSEAEIQANKEVVEELKSKLVDTVIVAKTVDVSNAVIQSTEQQDEEKTSQNKTIILTNKKQQK